MKSNSAVCAESVPPRSVRWLTLRASNEVVIRVEAVTTYMLEFAICQVAPLFGIEAEANRLSSASGRVPLENATGSSAPSLLTLLALLTLSRSPRNPSVPRRQCRISRLALGVQRQRRREVSLLRDRVLPCLLPGCSYTQESRTM